MLLFFTFISILTIIYWYPTQRMIGWVRPQIKGSLSRQEWLVRLTWIAVFLSMLLLVAHILLRHRAGFAPVANFLGWPGYLVLGFMTILFCLVLLRDVVLLPVFFRHWRKKWQKRQQDHIQKQAKPDLQRRAFLMRGTDAAIFCTGLTASSYGFVQASQDPTLVEQRISLPKLHPDLYGLRILQISDIHVGPTIKGDFIERLVDQCQDIHPDILVLTGDLVDGSAAHLDKEVVSLAKLQPRLGKYFITGNHEYYSGVEAWLHVVERLGFTVLINEHRTIRQGQGALTMAGVTDLQGGQFLPSHQSDVQKAVQGREPESCTILLAHQPKSVYQAAEAGVDLQLSGHTHGGQYYPGNFMVVLDQPFVAGLYQYKQTQLYVNQGTGYWGPPLRLGTFPEITLFTLHG